ncbi:MAG: hypothetical protein ACKV2T_15465 [Kofleriaceae bacterium]
MGGGAAATRSRLNFTGDRELDIQQYAVTATVGYVRPSRLSIRGSVGAIVDGRLEGGGRIHNIGPGVVMAASVAKQWTRDPWFATASFGMAFSRTTTTEAGMRQSLIATDLARVGVIAGRTLGAFSPYVLARGFAGPVFWRLDDEDVGGSDTHFFQLGLGASVATRAGLSVVVDLALLGEQSAALAVAMRL